jgi:hypothetical protein
MAGGEIAIGESAEEHRKRWFSAGASLFDAIKVFGFNPLSLVIDLHFIGSEVRFL